MVQKHSLLLEPYLWRQHIGAATAPGSFSGLLDLVIDIPSIIASAHGLSKDKRIYINLTTYIDRLIQKFHDLDHWRILYNKCIWSQDGKPVYWSVPAIASNPTDSNHLERLFPFALIFSSIQAASAWIFCSSIMLDILDTVLLLCPPNHNDSTIRAHNDDSSKHSIATDVLEGIPAHARGLARLLCQSMEFCYRNGNGTFGPQITCYAQATLLRYFKHRGMGRELDWCRAIPHMSCPGASFGIDLMQFNLFDI